MMAVAAVSGEFKPPAKAWYFALPNQDYAGGLRELETLYDIGPERRVERGGYAMSFYELRVRSGENSKPQ
jgi:hypothetical protein